MNFGVPQFIDTVTVESDCKNFDSANIGEYVGETDKGASIYKLQKHDMFSLVLFLMGETNYDSVICAKKWENKLNIYINSNNLSSTTSNTNGKDKISSKIL